MSSYKETLSYLYSRLPMFQRIGAAAYKANLDNTHAIMSLLGHPENKFKSVHIAGTNGKGSSSHMLAAVLQSAGYKVGLYTSPHLKDFRERIRINGRMISRQYITDFVNRYQAPFEKIEPSFFEWTVGLAFDYFSKQKVDIAIIETGLGGRLDSTNVITPLVSLITNISKDHQNLLGNTLELIAIEKAGIIKKGVPVVIGEYQEETHFVFEQTASKRRAPLYLAGNHFRIRLNKAPARADVLLADVFQEGQLILKNLSCDLAGSYQQKNLPAVLQTVVLLQKAGFTLSNKDLRKGLGNVKTLTGLRGRWEKLGTKPLTYADTGHNEAGIKEVLKQIRRTPHKNLFFVLGMVSDKDISSILSLLPKKARYFFCKASVPRAMDARELQEKAGVYGLKGECWPTVKKAAKAARLQARSSDLVVIGGSTFTVADAI
jgi:dihydrofolate synthase/folylpolyglutamate synthase